MKINPSIKQETGRPGFTLVELLVAMALILFIMSIISAAFVDSSESFRLFRGRMELSEKLRTITQTLRMDLRANHFGDGRKLSDDDFWDQGPPDIGYFRIEQKSRFTSSVSSVDGSDSLITSMPSSGHALMFSSFLYGGDSRGFFSAAISSSLVRFNLARSSFLKPSDSRLEEGLGEFKSPDAEVAWFLGPGATDDIVLNDEPGNPTVKLHRLYRRRWLLLPTPPTSPFVLTPPDSIELATEKTKAILSFVPGTIPVSVNFIDSADKPSIDVPQRRVIGNYLSPVDFRRAKLDSSIAGNEDSLVADNVLSFTVEVWNPFRNRFGSLQDYYSDLMSLSFVYPAASSTNERVYDTWSKRDMSGSGGLDYRNWNSVVPGSEDLRVVPMPVKPASGTIPVAIPTIQAIRVTIRLYDWRTKSTAQATVIESP